MRKDDGCNDYVEEEKQFQNSYALKTVKKLIIPSILVYLVKAYHLQKKWSPFIFYDLVWNSFRYHVSFVSVLYFELKLIIKHVFDIHPYQGKTIYRYRNSLPPSNPTTFSYPPSLLFSWQWANKPSCLSVRSKGNKRILLKTKTKTICCQPP